MKIYMKEEDFDKLTLLRYEYQQARIFSDPIDLLQKQINLLDAICNCLLIPLEVKEEKDES